jgi:hypothetical protein
MRSRTEKTEEENREVFWREKMISCILNVLNELNCLQNKVFIQKE